jgi:hypothetical protein
MLAMCGEGTPTARYGHGGHAQRHTLTRARNAFGMDNTFNLFLTHTHNLLGARPLTTTAAAVIQEGKAVFAGTLE